MMNEILLREYPFPLISTFFLNLIFSFWITPSSLIILYLPSLKIIRRRRKSSLHCHPRSSHSKQEKSCQPYADRLRKKNGRVFCDRKAHFTCLYAPQHPTNHSSTASALKTYLGESNAALTFVMSAAFVC